MPRSTLKAVLIFLGIVLWSLILLGTPPGLSMN
jgi:hypothetical protein